MLRPLVATPCPALRPRGFGETDLPGGEVKLREGTVGTGRSYRKPPGWSRAAVRWALGSLPAAQVRSTESWWQPGWEAGRPSH